MNAERIRVAAVGDLHRAKAMTPGTLAPVFGPVAERAEVLALCGDLTDTGTAEEAKLLVRELAIAKVPVVAVLGNQIDVIFSSGNGVAAVDDAWFQHSVEEEVFGRPVRLTPPEEMIWSKAFIMERERFDGGDVAHILRASAERLDWSRLVARFGDSWRVLMAHLVLFGFIYPGERHRIPPGVLSELSARLQRELAAPAAGERTCRGTILSRAQYLVDVERWGYADPRLAPQGNLTEREAAIWTAGIADDGPADALEAA